MPRKGEFPPLRPAIPWPSRRSGRVAEGGALLRRYGGECLHRGFESLLLRLTGAEGPLARAFVAERAGFEPATHLSARTRFPVALLRPLGHLSVEPAEGGRFELPTRLTTGNGFRDRRIRPLCHPSEGRTG